MIIQFNSTSTASAMQQAMKAQIEACPTKQVALKALKTLAIVFAEAGFVTGVAAAVVFAAGAAPVVAIALGGTAAILIAISAITLAGLAISARFGSQSTAKKAQVAPSQPVVTAKPPIT